MSRMTRYRLMVVSRILAAMIGGYALTAAISVLLALLLPVSRAEATQASTMLSFIIYAVVVIWVFSTRTATRAWIGLLVTALPLGLICWWLIAGGKA